MVFQMAGGMIAAFLAEHSITGVELPVKSAGRTALDWDAFTERDAVVNGQTFSAVVLVGRMPADAIPTAHETSNGKHVTPRKGLERKVATRFGDDAWRVSLCVGMSIRNGVLVPTDGDLVPDVVLCNLKARTPASTPAAGPTASPTATELTAAPQGNDQRQAATIAA